MHKKSLHNQKYDFDKLIQHYEPLKIHVYLNKYQTKTIDFSNPQAVKALNKALLFTYYHVEYWEFPDENLCPPIPSRVDYIHHIAELLNQSNLEDPIKILDIGIGATCIYPLLGRATYNWTFVGSDIDKKSLQVAQDIINKNNLENAIELRLQKNPQNIINGILQSSDRFAASVCNPPFFKSHADALNATQNKWKGLGRSDDSTVRNFGGTPTELCYAGGEKAFLHNYLYESSQHKLQCFWFTSLVSNIQHVRSMETSLKKLGATEIKVIEMSRGNKISRMVAWTFLTKAQQKEWQKK